MNEFFTSVGGIFFVLASGIGIMVTIFGAFWLCATVITVLLESIVKHMRYNGELLRFLMSRHKKQKDEDSEFFRRLWEE